MRSRQPSAAGLPPRSPGSFASAARSTFRRTSNGGPMIVHLDTSVLISAIVV